MPENVLSWSNHYRDLLALKSVDRHTLVATARNLAVAAQRRSYALTDRVLDQALR
jgi:hypothetical protein